MPISSPRSPAASLLAALLLFPSLAMASDPPPPNVSAPIQSEGDWRAASARGIETHRRGNFTLTVRDAAGRPLADHPIRVRLVRHAFLFGTAVATGRLLAQDADGERYRAFLATHFSGLVDENSMKWYHVEKQRGAYDFARADALVAFAKEHRLALRGHCLLWAKTKFLPEWARALPGPELEPLAFGQVQRMAERYRGKLVAWDVNNEMLDGQHFSQTIRPGIDAEIFKGAHAADPDTPLFVNEYHILDSDARTERYLKLIASLREAGAPVGGIGIQEHASERLAGELGSAEDELVERRSGDRLDPEGIRKRLGRLGALGLPIHLTEISAKTKDEARKADALEALFRVGFAHPSVEAILIWGFWENAHWMGRDAALVDADWNLLPAGRRIFEDLLGREWTTDLALRTDVSGTVRFRGFHGRYSVAPENGAAVEVGLGKAVPSAEVRLP